MNDASTVFGLIVALLCFVIMLLTFGAMLWIFQAWFRAFLAGTPVMVLQLIAMRLRGVPPGLIVDALITLVHRGHPHDQTHARIAESIYLAQRGLINSPAQLADQVEKQLKANKL